MRWFYLVVSCCLASLVLADTPADPYAYVTSTDSGKYFASVVPALMKEPHWDVVLREAYISIKECQDDGSFKELWRIKDFYSFRVFLSSDAKFLVAIGPWNMGDKPSKEDIALSFYKEGKLMRNFSTAEIIDDPAKVSVSVSHYQWQDYSDPQYPRLEDHLFEIKTTEGRVVAFGMTDDEILMGKEPLPGTTK